MCETQISDKKKDKLKNRSLFEVQKLKKKKDVHAARLASARAAKWGLWAIMVGMVILGSCRPEMEKRRDGVLLALQVFQSL